MSVCVDHMISTMQQQGGKYSTRMIQEMEFRKILNWMAETERIWKRKKTKEKKMEVNLGKKETIE